MNNDVTMTPAGEETTGKTVDLRELFSVIMSRIVWVALAVVICFTFAFCYTKITEKPTYSSQATVRIVRGGMATAADVAMATYMAQDYAIMASERVVLDEVIVNLDLDVGYSSLRSRLKVVLEDEGRIISMSFTDRYPQRAQLILEEIIKVTTDTVLGGASNPGAYDITGMPYEADKVASSLPRNLILGVLIGLVGSVGVITVIYILDDKIKSAEDINRVLGVPTLATVPYQRLREETPEGGEA